MLGADGDLRLMDLGRMDASGLIGCKLHCGVLYHFPVSFRLMT